MRSVFKYQIFHDCETVLGIPADARFLFFDYQRGNGLQAWFEVTPENPPQERRFRVFGTGHSFAECYAWLGSSATDAPFVWHLYERMNS